jgi:predicted lipoprotein with Yx(FWY)xxD motif
VASETTPGADIDASHVGQLGNVLVDNRGFTLYIFEPDAQSTSTCTGDCAIAWPPVVLPSDQSAPTAGATVQANLLGTTKRPDGGERVTYNGWPLYRWTGDTHAGQDTGEGLNSLGGLWYAISPKGDVVK